MNPGDKIYIAGHTGLVGSALVRAFRAAGMERLLLRTHRELDLTRQSEVEAFFEAERPDIVVDAAALVGGIKANSAAPADFYHVNALIADNLIWSAYTRGVKKFLFLGSACMYPRDCSQPMAEERLLTGLPEPTNEGYALAKLGGSRLCTYLNRQHGVEFISAVPANAYGVGDHFDENAHVIPSLLKRFHDARERGLPGVELWGTGAARREFLFSDDLADACLFLLERYSSPEPVNVGTGETVSIAQLARTIQHLTGYEGELRFDPSKPDGMPCRVLDASRLHAMGWEGKTSLEEGLRRVYRWYLEDALPAREGRS